MSSMPATPQIRERLLAWYDANARALPWRTGPADQAKGVRHRGLLQHHLGQPDAIGIGPHATPYFLKFLQRWPTVADLAAEKDEAVMAAWAGLGYYARARNLLACARAVARGHGGVFPDTEDGLLSLPGVGAYTAAAVAAIAFDRAANVVDGNVERVMARLYAVETPLPDAKPELKRLAGGLVTDQRPGDWAQALMDLGATVCRPKGPLCARCPLAQGCQALASGAPDTYPRRTRKADRPRRYGVAYLIMHDGRVGLVQRPAKGLLGGMLGLPTSDWRATPWSQIEAIETAPSIGDWRQVGEIEHVFTHFSLTLQVWRAEAYAGVESLIWTPIAGLEALPSVFLKAAKQGLNRLF